MAVEVGLRVRTLFSPGDDVQGEFLRWIQATENHLRIAIYGMHLPPLIRDLIVLHQRGVDVALVIDHVQAHGTAEHPEVEELRRASVPLLEGQSQRHRIMHHKFAVRDKASVWAGSWNFSESAQLESNYADVVDNPQRADLFLSKWNEIWEYMQVHDMRWND